MSKKKANIVALRDYSTIFSRSVFTEILKFDDFSHLDWLLSQYKNLNGKTYLNSIQKAYTSMAKEYRCEYIYKNELLKSLLKQYGKEDTAFFSEFRVGNSIADIVMFNGESKAFEIKTEYDSNRRLNKQIADYKKIFDKCFLVIPEEKYSEYLSCVDDATGIILMSRENGRVFLNEVKCAKQNPIFDTEILMSCLRISEYQDIAKYTGATLDNVSYYNLFSVCRKHIATINAEELRYYFLREMKKRKNNTRWLTDYPLPLLQVMLSLNLPENKALLLLNKLNMNPNKMV